MNKVILMGRLVRDPDVRYTEGSNSMAVAKYTLAINRRVQKDQEQTADFIGCTAFQQKAEFAEKYLRKGMKIIVIGRLRTESYTNREGRKVYTTTVIVDEQEFAEGKKSAEGTREPQENPPDKDGFSRVPDNEELPF